MALSWTRDRQYVLMRRASAQERRGPRRRGDRRRAARGRRRAVPGTTRRKDSSRRTASGWRSSRTKAAARKCSSSRSPTGGRGRRCRPAGGTQVRWSADGNEIFYVAPDGKMMAVSIAFGGASPDVKLPVPLFQTHLATGINVLGNKPQYAVVSRRTVPAQHRRRKRQRADRRVGELDEEAGEVTAPVRRSMATGSAATRYR